jgi:hypothetical protein
MKKTIPSFVVIVTVNDASVVAIVAITDFAIFVFSSIIIVKILTMIDMIKITTIIENMTHIPFDIPPYSFLKTKIFFNFFYDLKYTYNAPG